MLTEFRHNHDQLKYVLFIFKKTHTFDSIDIIYEK